MKITYIDISRISPNPEQARKVFATKEIESSIKKEGFKEEFSIVVRPYKDHYQIVEGEQRYLAAKSANLKKIPCFIRDLDDNQSFLESLKENLLRKNLEPVEEARFLAKLKATYPNNFLLAEMTGKSESYIRNRLKLLDLDSSLHSVLPLRKSEYLSEIKDKNLQTKLAPKLRKLGLEKAREIIDRIKYRKYSRRILKPSKHISLTEELANYLSLALETIRQLKETKKDFRKGDWKKSRILSKDIKANKKKIIEFLEKV